LSGFDSMARKASRKKEPAARQIDQTPDGIRGWVLFATRALLLLAAAISLYLAWWSLKGHPVPGCGPQSGCREVLHSRWAYWLGIPVSVPATGLYVATFVVTLLLAGRSWTWPLLLAACCLIIGASLWFLALQAFVLKRFCPFCTVADLSGLAAAALFMVHGAKRLQLSKTVPLGPVAAAVALLAALVVGQLVHQPKQWKISGGSDTAPDPGRKRDIEIFNGRFHFTIPEVPLLGMPAASNIIVILYDYTCETCREMHGSLGQVRKQLGAELAVIALPVPLDPACNPVLKQTLPAHSNACEYARIALAVHRAAPNEFEQFDEWLFSRPALPQLETARAEAVKLVGAQALEAALRDGTVDTQIKSNMNVFVASFLRGNGSLPQIISGDKVATGVFPRVEDIYQLLEQLIGLKRPLASGTVPKTNVVEPR
jgi:uncharacterized membrane protein